MRKTILSLVLIISVLTLCAFFSACGDNDPPDVTPPEVKPASYELEYSLSSDGAYFSVSCKIMREACDVVIPAEHESKPVKVISAGAFTRYANYLTGITVPEGITAIEDGAFSNCYRLSDITLPSTLTELSANAFTRCYALVEICNKSSLDLRSGDYGELGIATENIYTDESGQSMLSRIGDFVFFEREEERMLVTYKGSETEVVLPQGEDYKIRQAAFYQNNNIVSLTLPSCVTEIGSAAFVYCSRITEICNNTSLDLAIGSTEHGSVALNAENIYSDAEGESKLERSGDYLFYNGDVKVLSDYSGDAADITLPDGEEYVIGKFAFSGDFFIKSVSLPGNITGINTNAFSSCTKLESVRLGNGTEYIGDSAFSGCGKLKNIELPSSLREIGTRAFSLCTSLTSISIPSGVTEVGGYAFSYCMDLTEVTIADGVETLGERAFANCGSLKKADAGNVKTLESGVFEFCRELEELILGGVENVQTYVIVGCDSLEKLILPESLKSIYGSSFENTGKTELFYAGTAEDWEKITVSGTLSQTVYFYLENRPDESGNFWHYSDGVPVIW